MIHIGVLSIPWWAVYTTASIVAGILALIVVRRAVRMVRKAADGARASTMFYLVSLIATVISMDTSWRYFRDEMGITNVVERSIMFAIIEVTLVACGIAMRAGVRGEKKSPGPARILAWSICAMSAYMALQVSGPVTGVTRVILGPAWAVISLHLALGIEVMTRHGERTGTWNRIVREFRERALSRLGLADDDRDAAARTRDRAVARAARLATAKGVWLRERRLARALHKAGIALDENARGRLVSHMAVLRSVSELIKFVPESPWSSLPQRRIDQGEDEHPAIEGTTPEMAELESASLPEAPVSPAIPDLTEMTSTAAVVWAHVALGNVPAPRIVAWLREQGVQASEALVYKVRRTARQLNTDVSALTGITGEYPALSVVPSTVIESDDSEVA